MPINDPYASGSDGLALTDSSGAYDLSAFGGSEPITSSAAPDITTSGLPWGTGSGAAGGGGQTGYFTQPPSNSSGLNWGAGSASPGNGWSGTTWPTGASASGWLNSLVSAFTGVSRVQQNANAQAIAGQPLLTRLGLANGAGQITSTGMALVFAGLAIGALLLLKR